MVGMFPLTHGLLGVGGAENRHYNAIANLGLASSNLKLAYDYADSACFASSTTQRITDLSTEATHGMLGNSTSATTDDPTFNGTINGQGSSEYLSFDGGDFVKKETANSTWIDTLHMDNAVWSMILWCYVSTGQYVLAGTMNGSATEVGVFIELAGSTKLRLLVGTSTGFAGDFTSTGDVLRNAWNMISISFDETSTSGGRFALYSTASTSVNTFDAVHTSTTSTATRKLSLYADGANGNIVTNLFRARSAFFWQGTALSTTNIQNIFDQTKASMGF